MRKVYEKPKVLIENFTLTESIAACDQVNVVSVLQCDKTDWKLEAAYEGYVDIDKGLPFIDANSCELKGDQIEYGDGWKICYHTSQDSALSVFNS